MPFLLEPYKFFKRGVHQAVEVDRERVQRVREALELAAVYAKTEPLVALINEVSPRLSYAAQNFFESDDGYPICSSLRHHVAHICRAPDAEPFGLDIFGAIFAHDLRIGQPLLDQEAPVSPEWLAADPALPYFHAPASQFVAEIDFSAGIDADAISDVNDAFDTGDLNLDVAGVGDVQTVDVFDKWHTELDTRLRDFRDRLVEIAEREGHVMSWYEDNPAL